MEGKVPYIIMLIAAVGVLSWFIRAIPFLLFGGSGEPPRLVAFVGKVLSPAAIAMLAVYCFAGYVCDRPPADNCWCAAEAIAGTVTVALQWKWRNPPLSIAAGTVLYMMLVS